MKEFNNSELAAGYWQLAVGSWLLATGCRLLAEPCKELLVSKRIAGLAWFTKVTF